jgi:hypothetical protein
VVDIQTVSIAIASASVVAGIVYYAFQLRHQSKIREMDAIVRMNPSVLTFQQHQNRFSFL